MEEQHYSLHKRWGGSLAELKTAVRRSSTGRILWSRAEKILPGEKVV